MTRQTLHDDYSSLLMNIHSWGADIGVGAYSAPSVPVLEQEVYAIVISKLDVLSKDRKQMIEEAGLQIDVIDMANGEIILVPPTTN